MSQTNEVAVFYPDTVSATFIKRNNRFTATVQLENRTEIVHVKNTGRLKELLLPGAPVTLQKSDQPNRKTAYDLISVKHARLGWVNIDSLAPNALVRQALKFDGYTLVKPEYTYGNSRVDFYMEKNRERYLCEVKGCTLAPDPASGIGLFPDAPTERGVKHLRELTEASRLGFHCSIAFVIQMNGIQRVHPNIATQPEFGIALSDAVTAGVHIVYYRCEVTKDRIRLLECTEHETFPE